MHPSKIAKSFWGYSFIIFNTVLSPKRRNPLYEWAKSALKPQSDERAGEIHGYTVAEQRYPWAKVPQAHLHLLGLIAKVFLLPLKIAKKSTCTFMIKILAK